MDKINLTELVRNIEVWTPWLDNYKKYIPKFIEEAAKGINWSEWNPDTFYMYFNELTEHPVSSMKQGYFTKREREAIKNNWMTFAPELKEIAISQNIPRFEFYDKIVRTINDMCDNNRYASIYRMIAGLQPNLLCSIVNEGKLDTLCRYINNKCDIEIDFSGDYFHKSNKICNLFNSIMSNNSPIENVTLPWQTLEEFYELENNKNKMKQNLLSIVRLLEYNKNLILSGAPGTGKTYLAKQLACMMITGKAKVEDLLEEEKKIYKERHGFVQFHPSYDYTDFIEGLRPIHKEGSAEIGFERKDGIFMEFCREALKAPKENFVFIIDEINRGEISKIFGELFFSIDPGYRGTDGKVNTQYSNLWKESDYYDGGREFYVPENVYIIGTMNDIDRSVESMDFAFRRRFAFKEIKASENTGMLDVLENEDLKKDVICRMERLNAEISQCPGLNSSYHVGASYFLKLNNYKDDTTEDQFVQLWDNHLEPLLKEYLRGLPNADELLVKLWEAYNGKDANVDNNEAAN